jgi:Flp pilus assembly protein TadD
MLVLEPENPEALNFLGYTLADQGLQLERALDLIQRALEKEPESGFIVDSLAWVYFRLGEMDKAWQEIQRAVTLVDDDPFLWEHYGDIAAANDLPAEARKGYRKALDLGHTEAERVRTKLNEL